MAKARVQIRTKVVRKYANTPKIKQPTSLSLIKLLNDLNK